MYFTLSISLAVQTIGRFWGIFWFGLTAAPSGMGRLSLSLFLILRLADRSCRHVQTHLPRHTGKISYTRMAKMKLLSKSRVERILSG